MLKRGNGNQGIASLGAEFRGPNLSFYSKQELRL